MKIKGTGKTGKVIVSEPALEFANTIRGQYIISQALTIARGVLVKYEEGNEMDLRYAEPSNRADMDYLLDAFPLYRIHHVINKEYEEMKNEQADDNLFKKVKIESEKGDKNDTK